MSDDKLAPVHCGECTKIVASQAGNAIIIKENHHGQQHITIITVDRMLGEPNLKPTLKRV